ncbi:LysE/ArgO family amino acid transporter [Microbacterium koreense]|uniref:LysE/ArgO family amino acid transporter n=1 Tax=Microbacterium koreense TaxID=323761 RepID=A0ABW2ZPW1_9MICO
MLTSVLAGFGLGLSLIVAIGAQNLFVLRQGLRREHLVAVVVICAASDAALIALGVSGVGLALQALPWLVTVVRWVGFAFLIGYGLLAARRAWRPSGEALEVHEVEASVDAPPSAMAMATVTRTRLAPVALTALALTWLNPHVYLDTVFLLGSIASTHGDLRWWFAAGAMAASVVWFVGLAFGARLLGRWLSSPRAWRILDGIIAVIMIALGISLVLPH